MDLVSVQFLDEPVDFLYLLLGIIDALHQHDLQIDSSRKLAAKIWNVPVENIDPKPSYHTVEMFRALDRGDIRFMWIQITNPMVTMPNLNRYRNGAKKDDRFVVRTELPGVKEEDVHVNIEGNILTFTGERKSEEEISKEHYHRTERYYGSFCRSFAIPDSVDRDKIKATFKSGMMKLDLPKKEEVKPKEIKIEVEK